MRRNWQSCGGGIGGPRGHLTPRSKVGRVLTLGSPKLVQAFFRVIQGGRGHLGACVWAAEKLEKSTHNHTDDAYAVRIRYA